MKIAQILEINKPVTKEELGTSLKEFLGFRFVRVPTMPSRKDIISGKLTEDDILSVLKEESSKNDREYRNNRVLAIFNESIHIMGLGLKDTSFLYFINLSNIEGMIKGDTWAMLIYYKKNPSFPFSLKKRVLNFTKNALIDCNVDDYSTLRIYS